MAYMGFFIKGWAGCALPLLLSPMWRARGKRGKEKWGEGEEL